MHYVVPEMEVTLFKKVNIVTQSITDGGSTDGNGDGVTAPDEEW